MIKLTLPDKPAELTKNEAALTAEFRADPSKTVWKKDYISQPLLKMSHDKCAYSETKLQEESKYMEIEHFKHKDKYPDDVVRWGNLLPSCKTCNINKGTWDVVAYPIINPIVDDPKEHLYLNSFRFYAKDKKGQNTLDAVGINDLDHFMVPRFRTANYTVGRIQSAFELLKEADTPRKKHVRLNNLKQILLKCGPESVYSASTATYLLYGWEGFNDVKDFLSSNGYWDEDFEQILTTLNDLALPKP